MRTNCIYTLLQCTFRAKQRKGEKAYSKCNDKNIGKFAVKIL